MMMMMMGDDDDDEMTTTTKKRTSSSKRYSTGEGKANPNASERRDTTNDERDEDERGIFTCASTMKETT